MSRVDAKERKVEVEKEADRVENGHLRHNFLWSCRHMTTHQQCTAALYFFFKTYTPWYGCRKGRNGTDPRNLLSQTGSRSGSPISSCLKIEKKL